VKGKESMDRRGVTREGEAEEERERERKGTHSRKAVMSPSKNGCLPVRR
jgi:hypothetical protein